jgi:hypothetical protein
LCSLPDKSHCTITIISCFCLTVPRELHHGSKHICIPHWTFQSLEGFTCRK